MFHVQRTCDLFLNLKFSAWEKERRSVSRTFNASFDSCCDNDSPQANNMLKYSTMKSSHFFNSCDKHTEHERQMKQAS